MNQSEKAKHFATLHRKGAPVVLYNIWDAGGAAAVTAAGASAVATGSWSVAAAQGYPDGEAIPLDFLELILARIVRATDLPVTVDFEGGYDASPDALARNVARVIELGAVGINFEDQVVAGDGLYAVEEQSGRIAAIRRQAESMGVPLFINSRTDLFLQETDAARHGGLLDSAIRRASAYADAGASGFFVPGLVDETLIAEVCKATDLPVNVMMMDIGQSIKPYAKTGVARISLGPRPYAAAMDDLLDKAAYVYGGG